MDKFLYWFPRLLTIAAILFVSMFALDAFDPKLNFWQQIAGFAIHSIPSVVLLILLIIAWKWELIGGILFALIGLLATPWVFHHNYQMNNNVWMSLSIVLLITFPFIVVGALFILNYFHSPNKPLH